MKRLHLICNAHIDPVWQWESDEGISAALSTFQSAANLCDEYDYIFCHNEVLLYKAIEEHAPELFKKIQQLVKQGKWKIMGGWYLQPDCNMPSGESITRQCLVGHAYFKKKFGVYPTTAINFDPFGHNRGIVQILNKCGQDSYICMRPWAREIYPKIVSKEELPTQYERFNWIGYDGSSVAVSRSYYLTPYGKAAERMKNDAETLKDKYNTGLFLWGVGNHGGGPSRKDLSDLEAAAKQDLGYEIVHSYPEQYFKEAASEITDNYDKSLLISMPGCYTSAIQLKQKHIALENTLYRAEKLCSLASLKGLMEYPADLLTEAEEQLLLSEFHDTLPGSSAMNVIEKSLDELGAGLSKATRAATRAVYALCKEQPVAEANEYPIMVFNPNPYKVTTTVECEVHVNDPYRLADNERFVYKLSRGGKPITLQLAKAHSNFNQKNIGRKRLCFDVTLEPFCMDRFNYYITTETYDNSNDPEIRRYQDIYNAYKTEDGFTYKDGTKQVVIGKTGLLEKFEVNGKDYLSGKAFLPVMYDDNADPWGMSAEQLIKMGENPTPFEPMKNATGVFKDMNAVQVIEDGPLFAEVEAFFELASSRVRISYKIYKNRPEIDVDVKVFWNEKEKLLKLEIPTVGAEKYLGQGMFGTEELFNDGRECVAQRFTAAKYGDEKCLGIINRSLYGSSFKNGTVSLTLVRGAAFCSHPIGQEELLPPNRFVDIVDQGQHDYHFKLAACDEKELDALATQFNQSVYALNVFPTKNNLSNTAPAVLNLDNGNITMPAFKYSKDKNGYIIRLLNNFKAPQSATLTFNGASLLLNFGKYEVKSVLLKDGTLTELEGLAI